MHSNESKRVRPVPKDQLSISITHKSKRDHNLFFLLLETHPLVSGEKELKILSCIIEGQFRAMGKFGVELKERLHIHRGGVPFPLLSAPRFLRTSK
jgi:hypothetical protein